MGIKSNVQEICDDINPFVSARGQRFENNVATAASKHTTPFENLRGLNVEHIQRVSRVIFRTTRTSRVESGRVGSG